MQEFQRLGDDTGAVTTVKMAADASAEGQKIASSRFKTPKEEVKDAYEKWADAYEHDSLEKLGFASPKVCVQTLLEFCPPEGRTSWTSAPAPACSRR